MFKFLNNFLIVFYLFSLANTQNVPTLDTFLAWLLDVTSNEIENLANNFDFHEVASSDIKFIWHIPGNKTKILNPKNLTLLDSSKQTKLMIHGWQASGTDDVNKELANEYHKKGNTNFIAVDWSEHSKKIYMHASSSTKNIGDIVADFVLELTKNNLEELTNIHLIGHSLGGHVAGFAGKRVKRQSAKKIGRITGLDVAAPMFEIPRKRSSDSRLSSEDAEFVDVIHTNSGFLGISNAVGTADFYVENGGPVQPGCLDPLNIFESFACSHLKSFEYFKDSIYKKIFEALSCPNSIDYHILACNNNKKVIMGENVPSTARGTYYLETGSPLPYSKLLDNPLGLKINTPKIRFPLPQIKLSKIN